MNRSTSKHVNCLNGSTSTNGDCSSISGCTKVQTACTSVNGGSSGCTSCSVTNDDNVSDVTSEHVGCLNGRTSTYVPGVGSRTCTNCYGSGISCGGQVQTACTSVNCGRSSSTSCTITNDYGVCSVTGKHVDCLGSRAGTYVPGVGSRTSTNSDCSSISRSGNVQAACTSTEGHCASGASSVVANVDNVSCGSRTNVNG